MPISIIKPENKEYPDLLKQIHNPPKQLYRVGEKLLHDEIRIAIVGSRKASSYGHQVTYMLARDLANAGCTIVSGLALGVDSIAHKATVESRGRTIAVQACGLDKIYPSSHRDLARQIINSGGSIISEYEIGTQPFKSNFPMRNRVISGISHAVVITEAAEKSGSLVTARFALEQNREVFAVPGNITNPLSKGTNNLIKSGAMPVSDASEILEALGLEKKRQQRLIKPDNPFEAKIYALLQDGVSSHEELLIRVGMEANEFNQQITMMELNGKIKTMDGGRVIRA